MFSHLSGSSARPAHARPMGHHTAVAPRLAGGSLSGVRAAAARPAGGSLSGVSAARPVASRLSGAAVPQMSGGYLQPTVAPALGAYAETTSAGGMNLLRPAGPRTNPNNLLAGGRVIDERVVDINELLATGKLIEAPAVRDQ